jgi:predicted nucleic acid-binding protein
MNGNSVLLDTNIVLYLLGGDKVLAELLNQKKLYLSFISQLELLGFRGITQKQQTTSMKKLRRKSYNYANPLN